MNEGETKIQWSKTPSIHRYIHLRCCVSVRTCAQDNTFLLLFHFSFRLLSLFFNFFLPFPKVFHEMIKAWFFTCSLIFLNFSFFIHSLIHLYDSQWQILTDAPSPSYSPFCSAILTLSFLLPSSSPSFLFSPPSSLLPPFLTTILYKPSKHHIILVLLFPVMSSLSLLTSHTLYYTLLHDTILYYMR